MTERDSFNQIDIAIDSFKKKEGLHKGIKVSKNPHSDWIIYNWRQLTWTEDDINRLIEVYLTFDEQENITGLNLYAAAYYDQSKSRYYLKKHFAENKPIDEIAKNAEPLLLESYFFVKDIKREEIPFAVELN